MSTDNTFELYKLEYEKGVERYENIYKAVWANFSYLTVVSGGIYAFGSRLFSWEWTVVLATLPLFFWWLAIFEPMNRYGDEVAGRLSEVELILNAAYWSQFVSPALRNSPVGLPATYTDYGLRHFTRFTNRLDKFAWGDLLPWRAAAWLSHGLIRRPRTRYWIRTLIPSLFVAAMLFAVGVIPPTLFSKDDTVIINRPGKLDGRIIGMDVQVLKDEAGRDDKIKQNLQKLDEALRAVSEDAKKLKSQ